MRLASHRSKQYDICMYLAFPKGKFFELPISSSYLSNIFATLTLTVTVINKMRLMHSEDG